jgi:hypothetical protein
MTQVEMKVFSKGNGTITIPFRSDEDLDRIISRLEG